jgi:amino acid adenylation domain-containing protein
MRRSMTDRGDEHPAACLADLLRRQADSQPGAVAVTCGPRHLTYEELAAAGNRLARYLRHLGVGADDCIGVYVDPSLDLMAGVWGILFAGAAYLPLSPEYPENRVRYMIEDSGTGVIVTQDHLVARLVDLAPQGTCVVTMADAERFVADGEGPADVAEPASRPFDLAYVIYTSGSSGKPKGVMIEQRSIVSQMRWLHGCGHVGEGTTVLQKTPMSFDAAQWEILAPAMGGRVVMGATGIYRDPQALIATIAEHRVDVLQCVPTLLQALLDTGELHTCTTLARVFSGGEALSRQLARAFREALPRTSLVNLYGPTETTINATAHAVDPESIGEGPGTIPIGLPVAGTECLILDAGMAPVGPGERGELYVGGVQVARGYLGRPVETRERFVASPFRRGHRLYRTGDLACWNPDGTIQFCGRADDQVKLRGHRVELNEIGLAIEEHPWVNRAVAIVTDNARTGSQNLVVCIELNAQEAAVMDQGDHGAHHQSKRCKLQVKAQLASPGIRNPEELDGRATLQLPGKLESRRQRRETFARKTYRLFEGGRVTRADIEALLAARPVSDHARRLEDLTFTQLGEILRWFGPFRSDERLLPKYAYASPGALYATQLYLETRGMDGLSAGVHYYHPVDHTLVRIGSAANAPDNSLLVHFVGNKRAIEPVYKNNIQEVLELEAGHMVGVFEEVLPACGLTIRPLGYDWSVKHRLDVAGEDYYLGTFEIHANDGMARPDPTEIYVQAHPGAVDGLPAGQYRHTGTELERIAGDVVLPKHVIAINQRTYGQASFGITAVSRASQAWLEYVSLGTKLHRLQRNDRRLGLMSSGYSSKTGNALATASRIDDILAARGIASGASYFFLGGKVSDEQIASEGMREDAVHMKGPAEIIKDEVAKFLPAYMLPNRAVITDKMPLTANGKVDRRALEAADDMRAEDPERPYAAPATSAEHWLVEAWGTALRYEHVSVNDDFFAAGGNSLIAVALINKINRELGKELPLEVLFRYPRLSDLAARIEDTAGEPSSRAVLLHDEGAGAPVFCWPGLGGYSMNLRLLGGEAGLGRPFYGIQAHGINDGEVPHPTIREMAAADIAELRRVQAEGPYTLWGYSFGARVAFEAAWQLEVIGEQVEHLLLICPGNPKVRGADANRFGRDASYANPAYLTILYSVFAGSIAGPDLDRCLAFARDEDSFVAFVHTLLPDLGEELIRRITRIVGETYEFEYSFRELNERKLKAPVTIFKASGDDYSFIEGRSGYSAAAPGVIQLHGDHYGVLKRHGVGELASAIRARFGMDARPLAA